MIERAIRFERRRTLSPRAQFNRDGDWLPRLVVWPEYDGKDKDTFEETSGAPVDDDSDRAWGEIISSALLELACRQSLVAYEYDCGLISRFVSWSWIPRFVRVGSGLPDAGAISEREHQASFSSFLLAPRDRAAAAPKRIRAELLDRVSLLPFGSAIFAFGVEEAVLEIAFAGGDEPFLEVLRAKASERGHDCVEANQPFLSHWVRANRARYGADWNRF